MGSEERDRKHHFFPGASQLHAGAGLLLMLQDKPLHILVSFVPLTQGIRTEATSQGLSSPTPLQAAVCLHHSAVVFVQHLYLSTHFSERVLAGSQDPGLSRTLCLIPTL